MPAYLVQAVKGHTRINGTDAMVVFAADAADARGIANGYYSNDPAGSFDGATVTEIVAGTDLSGLELAIKILDSTTPVSIVAPSTGLSVFSGEITAAGTGYSVSDILTLAGGTFTRAATFRVNTVSTGGVTGIELVDPGEYSVLPSGASAVTGGDGNDDCTITPTGGSDRIENCAAAAVGLLNADLQIDGAAIDFGDAGGPLLTIALGSGGDDLGDKAVTVEARVAGGVIGAFVSTITDEGVATDDLSVLLPVVSSYPAVAAPVKLS